MDSTYVDPSSLAPMIAMFAAFMVFFVIIGIVFYLFFSIGLYKLAKNDGDDIAWMAFIPVAQYYTMGNLIKGNFTVFGKRIDRIEIILPVAMLVGGILSAIPVIGVLIAIALMILYISVVYHLYKKYKGERATMFTILSVIFSFLFPFFIFAMRNATPVDLSYGTASVSNGFQNGYNGQSGNNQNSYNNNYENYNNNNFNTYDINSNDSSLDNNSSADNNSGFDNNSSFDNNDGGNNQD